MAIGRYKKTFNPNKMKPKTKRYLATIGIATIIPIVLLTGWSLNGKKWYTPVIYGVVADMVLLTAGIILTKNQS